MKHLLLYGIPLILIFMIATARPEDTPDSLLESHVWENRVVVMLCANDTSKACITQRTMLAANPSGMKKRDIVVYDVVKYNYAKRDGVALPHLPASRFFEFFRIPDAPFAVIVIGIDGAEKHRQTTPLTTENLFILIDAMPMRRNTK